MNEIKEYMTFNEIQSIGGFQKLGELGYEYYELYHKLPSGEMEGHGLYGVYKV